MKPSHPGISQESFEKRHPHGLQAPPVECDNLFDSLAASHRQDAISGGFVDEWNNTMLVLPPTEVRPKRRGSASPSAPAPRVIVQGSHRQALAGSAANNPAAPPTKPPPVKAQEPSSENLNVLSGSLTASLPPRSILNSKIVYGNADGSKVEPETRDCLDNRPGVKASTAVKRPADNSASWEDPKKQKAGQQDSFTLTATQPFAAAAYEGPTTQGAVFYMHSPTKKRGRKSAGPVSSSGGQTTALGSLGGNHSAPAVGGGKTANAETKLDPPVYSDDDCDDILDLKRSKKASDASDGADASGSANPSNAAPPAAPLALQQKAKQSDVPGTDATVTGAAVSVPTAALTPCAVISAPEEKQTAPHVEGARSGADAPSVIPSTSDEEDVVVAPVPPPAAVAEPVKHSELSLGLSTAAAPTAAGKVEAAIASEAAAVKAPPPLVQDSAQFTDSLDGLSAAASGAAADVKKKAPAAAQKFKQSKLSFAPRAAAAAGAETTATGSTAAATAGSMAAVTTGTGTSNPALYRRSWETAIEGRDWLNAIMNFKEAGRATGGRGKFDDSREDLLGEKEALAQAEANSFPDGILSFGKSSLFRRATELEQIAMKEEAEKLAPSSGSEKPEKKDNLLPENILMNGIVEAAKLLGVNIERANECCYADCAVETERGWVRGQLKICETRTLGWMKFGSGGDETLYQKYNGQLMILYCPFADEAIVASADEFKDVTNKGHINLVAGIEQRGSPTSNLVLNFGRAHGHDPAPAIARQIRDVVATLVNDPDADHMFVSYETAMAASPNNTLEHKAKASLQAAFDRCGGDMQDAIFDGQEWDFTLKRAGSNGRRYGIQHKSFYYIQEHDLLQVKLKTSHGLYEYGSSKFSAVMVTANDYESKEQLDAFLMIPNSHILLNKGMKRDRVSIIKEAARKGVEYSYYAHFTRNKAQAGLGDSLLGYVMVFPGPDASPEEVDAFWDEVEYRAGDRGAHFPPAAVLLERKRILLRALPSAVAERADLVYLAEPRHQAVLERRWRDINCDATTMEGAMVELCKFTSAQADEHADHIEKLQNRDFIVESKARHDLLRQLKPSDCISLLTLADAPIRCKDDPDCSVEQHCKHCSGSAAGSSSDPMFCSRVADHRKKHMKAKETVARELAVNWSKMPKWLPDGVRKCKAAFQKQVLQWSTEEVLKMMMLDGILRIGWSPQLESISKPRARGSLRKLIGDHVEALVRQIPGLENAHVSDKVVKTLMNLMAKSNRMLEQQAAMVAAQ